MWASLFDLSSFDLLFLFQAANPGCLLEDFVRWYSPFDWIPGPETEEEMEELRRLNMNKGKESEESSASATGMETNTDKALLF